MPTLSETIQSWRTANQSGEGHNGLISKLQIGSSLYDIKDPAVEQLATAVESRLSTLETKTWTAVTKPANAGKFATEVTQGTDGAISVTYSGFTALNDTAVSHQFVTEVDQDADGQITVVRGAVYDTDVELASATKTALGLTGTTAYTSEALAALAQADADLVGTASDTSNDNTIYGAKAYADSVVANLAGTDWETNAKKVSEIIAELENSENANAWSTAIDKLAGMGWSATGTEGQPGYVAGNSNPTVVEYVSHRIAEVNAQNAQGIAALDAVVTGTSTDTANGTTTSGTSDAGSTAGTTYTNATSKVAVKLTEVDGVITAVDVKTNDIASATALTTLDNAAVKSVNGANPTNGAVTLYAGDVALSSSDNTTIAAQLTTLDTNKANKAAITTGSINNWATPTYASETLTWNNTATNVYIPSGTGTL